MMKEVVSLAKVCQVDERTGFEKLTSGPDSLFGFRSFFLMLTLSKSKRGK